LETTRLDTFSSHLSMFVWFPFDFTNSGILHRICDIMTSSSSSSGDLQTVIQECTNASSYPSQDDREGRTVLSGWFVHIYGLSQIMHRPRVSIDSVKLSALKPEISPLYNVLLSMA